MSFDETQWFGVLVDDPKTIEALLSMLHDDELIRKVELIEPGGVTIKEMEWVEHGPRGT
jgi:hypothetical protein